MRNSLNTCGQDKFFGEMVQGVLFCFFKASYNELHELQERIARLRAVSFSSDLVRGVHARASVERRSRETRETRARMVICVSRAFCSTDQEKRATACSLGYS